MKPSSKLLKQFVDKESTCPGLDSIVSAELVKGEFLGKNRYLLVVMYVPEVHALPVFNQPKPRNSKKQPTHSTQLRYACYPVINGRTLGHGSFSSILDTTYLYR